MDTLKLPPQNIEVEESVLGALLIDKDAIVKVAEFLESRHFYRDTNGLIYRAILDLYGRREPSDLVTVGNELKQKKLLKKIGGSSFLSSLVNKVPTAANIEHYAQIVKDSFTRRELISKAAEISNLCFDSDKNTKELLDQAEQNIFQISQEHVRRDFVPLKGVLADSFDRLDELHRKAGSLRGVPTGFRSLDNRLAGLQDSNLIIVAGRPSEGKTSLAVNIGQFVAVRHKIPVGFFSLEQSKEQLVDRMLSAQADVDAWRITTARLEEDDFDRLGQAMGELAEAPFYIDDTPAMSVLEMRTKARRLQIEKGLRLLIVDYLQLAHAQTRESRVQEVSEISRSLKDLARELRIPILVLSQLSRAIESRTSRQPQLSDLRESGSIEQDADIVMFLYRPDPDQREQVKLLIAKHRNGPTGEIDLLFRGEKTRFYEIEKEREEAIEKEA